jgi:hypothetical protein
MMRLKDMRYLRSDVVQNKLKILDQEDAEYERDPKSGQVMCEEGYPQKPSPPAKFKKPSNKLPLKKN